MHYQSSKRFYSTKKSFFFNYCKNNYAPFKKSISSELIALAPIFKGGKPPSKSAFLQARKKIKIDFFEALFYYTITIFYSTFNHPRKGAKKWRTFRLIACDGTGFRVPDNPENRKKIGTHKNQHRTIASCKAVAFHDVRNRLFINLFLHQREVSELSVVHQNFDKIPMDTLMIYDRAYGDSLLLARHLKANKHCLIRMKIGGSKILKAFMKSGQKENNVEFKIGERSYYSAVRKHGLKNRFPKFSTFQIRLIRIELANGVTEVLATTLLDYKKYPHAEFQQLYKERWGVETAFDEVKNQLKLGVFSGYNYQTVLQDIWAVFIFYNIRSLLIFEAEKCIKDQIKNTLKKNKNTSKNKIKKRHKQQINRNIAITIIRNQFFEILHFSTRNKSLNSILSMMIKHKTSIRERPTTIRSKKIMRSNSRHHTEKNYKPAF